MAKINAFQGLYSLQARVKYSRPNGLGLHRLGWTELGHHDEKAGDYQRHFNGVKYNWVRTRHRWPSPHNDEKTVARNNVFRNGVLAWQVLDAESKAYYNGLKYPSAQTGFTRFMTQYLKSH